MVSEIIRHSGDCIREPINGGYSEEKKNLAFRFRAPRLPRITPKISARGWNLRAQPKRGKENRDTHGAREYWFMLLNEQDK